MLCYRPSPVSASESPARFTTAPALLYVSECHWMMPSWHALRGSIKVMYGAKSSWDTLQFFYRPGERERERKKGLKKGQDFETYLGIR